jgi:hypothetical protein
MGVFRIRAEIGAGHSHEGPESHTLLPLPKVENEVEHLFALLALYHRFV